MSELQSFEKAYERESAAAMIVQELGHQVCEGLQKADWTVPELGAICMLHYYSERRIFQDGENIAVPTPFYLLHATYNHGGQNAVLRIDFENNFSIPTRKTIENRSTQSQTDISWDIAIGVCDLLMRSGTSQAIEKTQKQIAKPRLQVVKPAGKKT